MFDITKKPGNLLLNFVIIYMAIKVFASHTLLILINMHVFIPRKYIRNTYTQKCVLVLPSMVVRLRVVMTKEHRNKFSFQLSDATASLIVLDFKVITVTNQN